MRVARILSRVIAITLFLLAVSFIPALIRWDHATVLTGSMRPTMPIGSTIFIDQNDRTPSAGEIAMYQHSKDPSDVVTHRVIGSSVRSHTTFYIFKGDDNRVADAQPVPADHIIGTIKRPWAAFGLDAGPIAVPHFTAIMITIGVSLIIMALVSSPARPHTKENNES